MMSFYFSRKSTGDRACPRAFAAAATLLTAAATLFSPAGGGAARAQTMADPPNKPFDLAPVGPAAPSNSPTANPLILRTEKQSTVNPYPNGGGNAQNRAWAADDVFWGLTDADVSYLTPPLGRGTTFGFMSLTGWQFPRLSDYDSAPFATIALSDPNALNRTSAVSLTVTAFADGEAPSAAAPAPVGTLAFVPAPTTVSDDVVSQSAPNVAGYYEGLAFPRPASSALSYDANNKFVWRLDNPTPAVGSTLPSVTIPGAVGAQARYRIRVHIPQPRVPVGNTTASGASLPELRVSDARYTVYYYVLTSSGYKPRQLVCGLVPQTSGGDYELVAADGTEPVFPLFSSATFTARGVAAPLAVPTAGSMLPPQPTFATPGATPANPGTPTVNTPILQGVAVDNTTTDSGQNEFVLADSLTLIPGVNTVSPTPTITPTHGGALTVASGTGPGAIPIQTNEYLPDSGDINYNGTSNLPPQMADPNNVIDQTWTRWSYANDINDPQYAGAGYANYVPWDVSTYFQGPRSLIDPRYTGTDVNNNVWTNAQIGPIDPYLNDRPMLASAADPTNIALGQYITRPARASDATNNTPYPGPYFSHAQILVSRTHYVQDPETGISDSNKTGIKTIPVGEIEALDWRTGVPVWRFPDRTYLPQGSLLNGVAIKHSGQRNPQIGYDSVAKMPVFLVPGIVAIDVDGNGSISDDEVFLGSSQSVNVGGTLYTVTAGANTGGAVNASVTIAPRVLVQGNVQIPIHDLSQSPDPTVTTNTDTVGTDYEDSVATATPGRYYNPTANDYRPVPVGAAYIAAGNGVLYMVDAYGNNDTRYIDGGTIPTTTGGHYNGGTYFGKYFPGTTNVFWTFSATSHAQQPALNGKDAETTLTYDQRVMGEVPATSSFGSSSPVLAWNLTDSELTTPPASGPTPELRLFVGNTNGVLYAMDPTAQSGYTSHIDPMTGATVIDGVNTLPYVKGGQTDLASYYGITTASSSDHVSPYQNELKWWYRTQGGINLTPSVSPFRHDMSSFTAPAVEKGVYVSSTDGRVYCLDWDGPVDLTTPGLKAITAFDGTAGTAKNFNNDIYFHQKMPAFNNGLTDLKQGHVRPRWTYPALYRTNLAADVDKLSTDQQDGALSNPYSSDITGALLDDSGTTLASIQTPPVLIDFLWQDPDIMNSAQMLDYVAIVGNVASGSSALPTKSRVYLLDQIGDRVNFLTNPRKAGSNGNYRVVSQPRDQYNPGRLLTTTDTTATVGLTWTFRHQYDSYPSSAGAAQVQTSASIQLRNEPIFDTTGTPGVFNPDTSTIDPFVEHTVTSQQTGQAAGGTDSTAFILQPGRRMLPTIFAGGTGEVYAIDIDPETGVFMRWRPTLAEQLMFTPLRSLMVQGSALAAYPGLPSTTGTMSVDDQLQPLDHIFDTSIPPTGGSGSTASPNEFGYARSDLGTQEIFARLVELDSDPSAVTSLTVSGGPTQNRSNVVAENGVAQADPSTPANPTNDLPNLLPFAVATVVPSTLPGGGAMANGSNGMPIVNVDANGLPSAPLYPNSFALGGHITGRVNQDVNDPMATSAGRVASDPYTTPAADLHNTAFQYPVLFASTIGSYIHGLSTNVEGEDRTSALVTTPPAVNGVDVGDSNVVGWAIAPPGSDRRFNIHGHTNLFTIQGPGGLSGVSVFSNAYFPATDPYATAYRNAASVTSLNVAPNLDADEPNTTAGSNGPDGIGGTVVDPDDVGHPRPDFGVRPFVLAQNATATAPKTANDAHTGLSGFPLSLNGHFFDRRYAGAGGATQFPKLTAALPAYAATGFAGGTFGFSDTRNFNNDGQHPYGDYHVWPRVPGYSNIGSELTNPDTNLGLIFSDINNQGPDGIRVAGFVPNGTDSRLPVLPPNANPKLLDQISDDINPTGQDVAWFYVGGDNGVVYAYTPAIVGHETGLEGGTEYVSPESYAGGGTGRTATLNSAEQDGSDGLSPQVDIYTAADFQMIFGSLASGAADSVVARGVASGVTDAQTWPKRSVAARGGKNYYEWGETVYIVVYDLLARPITPTTTRYQRYVPNLTTTGGIPQGGTDHSIRLTITTSSGSPVNGSTLSMAGQNWATTGNGNLLEYYEAADGSYKVYSPTTSPAAATPLGVAIYKYVLGSTPSATNSQTPGDFLSINVTQATGGTNRIAQPRGGGTPAEQAAHSPAAYFSIANPLAVHGFLTATIGNTTLPVNPAKPAGTYDINGVGPFVAQANQFAGSVKQDDSTSIDPSQNGAEYWQALTNGNTVTRYDNRPYISQTVGGNTLLVPNPSIHTQIRIDGAGPEPSYYFPVVASAGYINHGTAGSTSGASGTNTQYMRLMNRSLVTGGLPNVRVAPNDKPSDLLFRAWPGKVMNAQADPTYNARITPVGMDPAGRINPLPWEVIPGEAKPWTQASTQSENPSQDYPDIPGRKNNALQVIAASGDLMNTSGTLAASVSTVVANGITSPVSNDSIGTGISGAGSQILPIYATSVNVTIPQYQPANLVGAVGLTSSYVAPNSRDFPTGVNPTALNSEGPLQMPRGIANRLLSYNGNEVVTPFGYTTQMTAYIDSDNQQRLYPQNSRVSGSIPGGTSTINLPQKAYRVFEVWAGVPVDQSLKIVESVVDLGSLAHGFAEQNGLLGYTASATNATGIGLTPLNPAYSTFFKPFTVQNTGNVNDYNLRPSQKSESLLTGDGTGSAFSYFIMRSPTVDPRYGILAVGADPLLPGIASPKLNPNVMPQIITSLDTIFDPLWDANTKTTLEAKLGTPAGDALYAAIYQPFGGRHTLHKPKAASQAPSVLGIPDQPTAQTLVPNTQLPTTAPAVAVAVPLGTPVGTYSSANGNSPFTIFEDHDTPNYAPLPLITTGAGTLTITPTIQPAGPLYHGQNAAPPGTNPIYSGGTNTTGEGVWRAQTAATANSRPVMLPFTSPYLTIQATVTENGLTGQFPDLESLAAPNINTGVLPSIDPLPIVTTDGTVYRPSAALTPAAWRGADGKMHVYFTRNDTASSGGSTTTPSGAQPGAPYALYQSTLDWDATNGVWKAANSGAPLSGPTANGGHWLSTPVAQPTSGQIKAATESNVSPYVLAHRDANYAVDKATLFFMNSVPGPNGTLANSIYFSDVTANGTAANATAYFLNADPSFARFAPRVAFDEKDNIDELMYYGGSAGHYGVYYVPRGATNGLPSDTAPDAAAKPGVERALPMPAAIVSASEPSPTYRQIADANGNPIQIVDVYFTGISRTTQTPDIYMNRYNIITDGTQPSGTLTPRPLPAVTGEILSSIGRSGVWRSASLAWLNTNTTLPVISWTYGGATSATVNANWKLDPSTGILYQAVQKNGSNAPTTLTYVYVDMSAGTVQFRGAQSPLVSDKVSADYTPQTARLTGDGASNFGEYSFNDPQVLPATPTGYGTILRRPLPMLSGRNYLFWQKGALAGKSPTLYYAVRRVGIDLNISSDQTILLSKRDPMTGDQTPMVSNVTINGNSVPYDVDIANGRIFVEPKWENSLISLQYIIVKKGTQGPTGATTATQTVTNQPLGYLDEKNVGAVGNFGAALPISVGINDGQASAFIDLYDWVGLGKSRNDPPASTTVSDPSLTPGRVWVFWTSPRGRTGKALTLPDPYPSGFNLYWETIAPDFEGTVY